jgi:hypothetical protein
MSGAAIAAVRIASRLIAMNSCIRRLTVSVAFGCLFAARASAQVVVQSVVQPDDIQLHEELRLEEKKRGNRPWSLSFGLSEGYESNVSGAPNDPGDHGTFLNAAGSRRWTLARGDVRLSGDVGQNIYHRVGSSNHLSYGMGANASWALTPRLSWNVGDSVSSGYAQDAKGLQDSGLLPPKLITYINTASTGLDYQLSKRGRLHWGIAQQNTTFDSSQVEGVTTTPIPSSLTTAMNIGRQLSRGQTVGVSMDYQRANNNGDSTGQGGILGTWQRAFGRSVSLSGSGGIRLYTVPGESGVQAAPGGSFSVVVRARRSDTFSVTYDRSTTIEQAGGALTHLGDSVGGGYFMKLGRVGLDATGYYARSFFPQDPSHKRYGHTVNTSAHYVIVNGLNLGVSYGFYNRVDTPSPPLKGYTARMFLSYGLNF